jgi:hypothetical protein
MIPRAMTYGGCNQESFCRMIQQGIAIPTSPLYLVLDRLKECGCEPRQRGAQWQARCPAHDDRNPSLSVAETTDGTVLLKCHRGCAPSAVVAALGLAMRDLFPVCGAGGHDGRRPPSAAAPLRPSPRPAVATHAQQGE